MSNKIFATPGQWFGGVLGIIGYIIIKALTDYGWHGGDIIGMFILGFLPGAALGGVIFSEFGK